MRGCHPPGSPLRSKGFSRLATPPSPHPPQFFVSDADKRLKFTVSTLESTVASGYGGVDSKDVIGEQLGFARG